MPYSEYDAKLMQNNEPRDQNSVQCPENGRSLLTVVFMSKLLLKFSASGWSTEVQKNCSPPMSAAPVKVAIYAWIVCRYAAMSLCHWLLTPLPSISTPRFPPSLMTLSTTWDRDQNQPDASRYVKHHGAMRINLWSIMQHQTEAPSSTCLSLPSLLLRV